MGFNSAFKGLNILTQNYSLPQKVQFLLHSLPSKHVSLTLNGYLGLLR